MKSTISSKEQITVPAVVREKLELAPGTAVRLWQKSRKPPASPCNRLVADVLIGAHAARHADALLTRDRGFYRGRFGTKVIDPSKR